MTGENRSSLESISPRDAVEMYLESIEAEMAQSTVYSHRSRLDHFLRWVARTAGVEHDMTEMTGRDLHEFKLWRRSDGDVNTVTMKTQMDTLRVFIRFCESIDAVPEGLSEKVLSPSLSKGDNVRDEMLDGQVAERILEWLETYRYASNQHVAFLLIWRCLLRRGAVRGIDVTDFDGDELVLRIKHRPETGTPVKNQGEANRFIALREETASVIEDYLDSPDRFDEPDDHGRDSLVTTRYGRPHQTTIAEWMYGLTRPCTVTNECPHGRDISSCDAAQRREDASKCPSSVSPHAVRRGAITHWLNSSVPVEGVSARASTSPDVISRHYDRRSEREKAEQRRKYLDLFD